MKKVILISCLIIVIISISLICYFNHTDTVEDRLTDEQIAMLREQYPICGTADIPTISLNPNIKLEYIIERVDSFVYGEVIGDYSTYYVNALTGKTELDAKRKANGIKDTFEFYEYTISVIDDSEGKHKKGDIITIADNVDFMDYNPKLSDGMKIVVPVFVRKTKNHPTRRDYDVCGMYYVTDAGYAISAYDETKATEKALTGIKVEQLLKELKK